MTDDLVQRLRLRAQPWRGGLHMPDKVVEVVEAADHIEWQADRLKELQGVLRVALKRIKQLEAELEKKGPAPTRTGGRA